MKTNHYLFKSVLTALKAAKILKLKNLTAAAVLLGLSTTTGMASAAPGYMANDVNVVGVSSTSSRQDAFWVWFTPKSSCNGKVKFQLVKSGTEGSFERAFTLATTALVSGRTINIYNYEDVANCHAAVAVELN